MKYKAGWNGKRCGWDSGGAILSSAQVPQISKSTPVKMNAHFLSSIPCFVFNTYSWSMSGLIVQNVSLCSPKLSCRSKTPYLSVYSVNI